jgi:hypothetical protein
VSELRSVVRESEALSFITKDAKRLLNDSEPRLVEREGAFEPFSPTFYSAPGSRLITRTATSTF